MKIRHIIFVLPLLAAAACVQPAPQPGPAWGVRSEPLPPETGVPAAMEDGLEAGKWEVVAWPGDHGTYPVTVKHADSADGHKTLCLEFASDKAGRQSKFAVRCALDKGAAAEKELLRMVVRLEGASTASLAAAFNVMGSDVDAAGTSYYESRSTSLEKDKTAEVVFNLAAKTFKCAETQWRHEAEAVYIGETSELYILCYHAPGAKGTLVLDRIRFE